MAGTLIGGRRAALVAAVWAVWFAVAMEWLFVATMPSFLDGLALSERLRVLLVAPLAVWAKRWGARLRAPAR